MGSNPVEASEFLDFICICLPFPFKRKLTKAQNLINYSIIKEREKFQVSESRIFHFKDRISRYRLKASLKIKRIKNENK